MLTEGECLSYGKFENQGQASSSEFFWPRYVTLAAHRLLICTRDAIGGVSRGGQLTGDDVQAAERFFPAHAGYDFILSAAVLEHLYDPLEVLRSMCSALNPGGMMIHRVDLRDHGAFSPSLHDLSFLRLPDWSYWPLRIRGGPNRFRVTDYRQCLVSLPVT